MAICVITTQKYRHFSLIAGVSRDEIRELTAFSYSYSATGGTRTRLWLPIEHEYGYRFTEYEYDFDMIDTGDQREVSKISICQYFLKNAASLNAWIFAKLLG